MSEKQHFGYSESILKEMKGIFTAVEIDQQPQTWIETVSQIKKMKFELQEKMKIFLNQKDTQVIFMGAGTSEFVGRALASEINSKVLCNVQACGTTDMIVAPENYVDPTKETLIVSFGRSGNSPESIGAVEAADAISSSTTHLLITCNPNGAMAKRATVKENCCSICLSEKTHDQSFAMTSSFSNMYLAALMCFNLDVIDVIEKEIKTIADYTENLLKNDYTKIEKMVNAFAFNRIVYLGAEGLKGISQESALKMLELTAGKVVTMFDTPMGFRHGPKSIVDDQTLTVVYLSENSYRRQYELDLIKEMSHQRKANKILVVGNKKCIDIEGLVDDVIQFELPLTQSLLVGLPAICVAQLIALFKSISLGITPDNPCPTGEVNRVVQGVVLYPFEKEGE
ncbi:MAG: SIS domain-containing protein [Anaerorhabdus sp.]